MAPTSESERCEVDFVRVLAPTPSNIGPISSKLLGVLDMWSPPAPRQNTTDSLPPIPLQEHVIVVRHTPAERALYLVQAREAPDPCSPEAFTHEASKLALERLLKLCTHFQTVGGDMASDVAYRPPFQDPVDATFKSTLVVGRRSSCVVLLGHVRCHFHPCPHISKTSRFFGDPAKTEL